MAGIVSWQVAVCHRQIDGLWKFLEQMTIDFQNFWTS